MPRILSFRASSGYVGGAPDLSLRASSAEANVAIASNNAKASIIDSPFNVRILRWFELAPILQFNSSRPFSVFTGTDSNGDRQSFADRPAGAGRNTGIGPDYFNVNLRLSWRHKMSEKSSIQLLAEAFNVANRTNYSNVNDTVGPAFAPPFKVHGSANLSPLQPLGFTADFPKREIQLGARVSF